MADTYEISRFFFKSKISTENQTSKIYNNILDTHTHTNKNRILLLHFGEINIILKYYTHIIFF
jgi:hypothetical protein